MALPKPRPKPVRATETLRLVRNDRFKADNVARAEELIDDAIRRGKTEVVVPELTASERRALTPLFEAVGWTLTYTPAYGLGNRPRRTNADKRRSVEMMLRDEEWSQLSNYQLASICECDEKTVRNIREDMQATARILITLS